MMSRYLLAACVARSAAFQARRTCRRALSTRALPPHLEQVKADVAAGAALLLDVREPPEALDASKCLYLHCAAGLRVHPAKACLKALGFDNVVSLREGIGELYELGFDALADRE